MTATRQALVAALIVFVTTSTTATVASGPVAADAGGWEPVVDITPPRLGAGGVREESTMRLRNRAVVAVMALVIAVPTAAATADPSSPGWGPVEQAVAPPQPFGTAGGGYGELATGPHVVIDDSGVTTVVGLESTRDERFRIRAVRRTADGTWGTPVTIARGPGYASETEVAVDRNGRVLVAWIARWKMHAAEYEPGVGWHAPELVATRAPRMVQTHMRLVMNRTGKALLVWEMEPADLPGNELANRVMAVERSAAGRWGAVRTLSRPGRKALRPYPAVSRGGGSFVVWSEYVEEYPDGRAMLSVRRPGKPWRAPVVLSPRRSFAVAAVPQPQGGVAAVWIRRYDDGARLEGSRRAGREPTSTVRALSRRGESITWPVAAGDARGNVTLAWLTRRGEVRVRDWRTGGRLTHLETLADGPRSWWGLQLRQNASGDAVMCWSSWSYGDRPMWAAFRPASDGWTTPLRMSARGDSNPSCGIGPTVRAAAVWRQPDRGILVRVLEK